MENYVSANVQPYGTASLEELTQQYQMVSQCWSDSRKAMTMNMTVEKALRTLRGIRLRAISLQNANGCGKRLARLACELSRQIIDNQVEAGEAELVVPSTDC